MGENLIILLFVFLCGFDNFLLLLEEFADPQLLHSLLWVLAEQGVGVQEFSISIQRRLVRHLEKAHWAAFEPLQRFQWRPLFDSCVEFWCLLDLKAGFLAPLRELGVLQKA